MRSKEEAHDYRYFPDPDLLPLELEDALIEKLRAQLPELPEAKRARFVEAYGLSIYDAEVLVAERASADFFEQAAQGRDAKLVANWVITELFGALNRSGQSIESSPVGAAALGQLVDLIAAGTISGRIAKDVFAEMLASGADPAAIVEQKGLSQISDAAAIERLVFEIIDANPGQVESYRKNPKALGWFVGQVMKATQGQANPQVVNEVLRRKLNA
jgi:aspartyl-tRNA(Asn)/glutamyl-tRNA(Gln) amidotransferase subunit B